MADEKDFSAAVADQPPNTFVLASEPNTATYVTLPNAGTLWVALEYGGPSAPNVYIWHQGGATEPVSPGIGNTHTVGAQDALVYDQYDGDMKLGWAYV